MKYSFLTFLPPLLLLFLLMGACEVNNSKLKPGKRIAILVGDKSHPATMHEYLKNARIIKVMLENVNLSEEVQVSIYYHGWPEDPGDLDSVDLILTLSDGRDGPNGVEVPFMTDERMEIIQKQIDRGCGFMTFHFSIFTPDKYGDEILEWVGGYFDWENEMGEREWYSDIEFLEEEVELLSTEHPVVNGVKPFTIIEEYYFNLRFLEADSRFAPIINIPELSSSRSGGGVVAWAIERNDGGRGFGTSIGHYYANWKNDGYRKLLLNAIVWTAGIKVPPNGIEVPYYTDRQVTERLYGKKFKGLILTGNNYPGHLWEETTPIIKEAVEENSSIHIDVSTNINDLNQYDLRDYEVIIFNYCNWEDPDPLWQGSKVALEEYVESGGGLMFIHFANGAFHYSLPEAGASDWPYYRKLCRRIWDHDSNSAHDKYGNFNVIINDASHEITKDISSFEIIDELYYNQKGSEPIHVLLSALSKDTGKEEPLAWTYELEGLNGKSTRVFQTVLGHGSESLESKEIKTILSNAAIWLARGTERWNDL